MSLQRLLSIVGLTLGLLVPLEALAALTVSIEMGPDHVRQSETFTAEITVANDGTSSVAGVVLQATVPANIVAINPALSSVPVSCPATVSNNGLCDPAEVMNWTLGTLPAGTSVTVSVGMIVANVSAGTVITLSPSVGASGASASVTVGASSGANSALVLAVDEDSDPIAAGGILTYTLTYGNRSTTAATGVALSFPLPAGTSFVSASGGGSQVGGNVQWALADLAAGQSAQQQVKVSVGGGLAAGSVLRVDAAVLSGTAAGADSVRAMSVTTVANPVLGLTVEMNPDPVRPTEWTVAQLTATNRTANPIFGVVLQARMPAGIDDVNPALATTAATAISCPAGILNNGVCDSLELGIWSLGTLPAGAAVTISIPFPINASTSPGRLVTLETLVKDDSSHQTAVKQTVAVDNDQPLVLALDENLDPIAPGSLLTYTLTYGNRSTVSVSGGALTFPVPAGTTFVSATNGGSLSGGSVQWNLGTLPATQSDQQQVVVSVDAGLTAGSPLLVDAARLTGTSTQPEEVRATAGTSVASALLGLAVEVNPDPVRPGEWATGELTVTNPTPNPIFGVVLEARMPQGITPVNPALITSTVSCPAGILNNGVCDAVELGSWTLGALPAGASTTVSIPFPIASTTASGRLVTAEVRVKDDSMHQSLMRQTLAVDSDQPLTLAVDEDADPTRPGGVLTYTLTYANRSTTAMASTNLRFPIPAGTTFVSATGGGTLSGGSVQWALGSLAATQSDQQQVAVAVSNALASGSLLMVDAAQLSATGVLAETARATAGTAVNSSPALGLAVELNPDPVRPDEWTNARLTVTNRTGANLFNVALQSRMPQSIKSINPGLVAGTVSCPAGISNNGLCDAVEIGNWALGTLAAGASVSRSFPVSVAAAAPAGRLLGLETRVSDDSSHQAVTTQTIAVDSDAPLTLAVDDDLDSVARGGMVTYSLTYGNRGTAALTGATLSFPLPALGSLAGSTGGVVSNGALVWDLGTIAAGTGGRRKVYINVPVATPAGSLLLPNEAVLRATGLLPESARGDVATAVEASKPLGLSVTFGRDPTQASAALTAGLSVTNNSGASLSGVVLEARVPALVGAFNPSVLTGGGTCVVGILNNGLCDPVERATWSLGTIAAGGVVAVSMPMTVVAGLANGRLVYLDAQVSDDSGHISTQTRTALVTPFVDADADTVHDAYDDCPFFANTSQVDTDLDGRGDACECTDQNGDGRNTVSDILAINSAIFNPGLVTPLCDGNNDGKCDVQDIIAANIEIFSPTSTSTCSRYPVPGP